MSLGAVRPWRVFAPHRFLKSTAVALAAVTTAALAISCVGGQQTDLAVPQGNPAEGERLLDDEVVQPSCGSCHTLEPAGWDAPFAPNLGLAQPGYQRILSAIRQGPGAMPSYTQSLTEDQMRNLAAYVADQVALADEGG